MKDGIPEIAPITDTTGSVQNWEYMTTEEASDFMRKSVSWLLRQKDIPFYRGKPNLYKKDDLDNWLNQNRRYEPIGYFKG